MNIFKRVVMGALLLLPSLALAAGGASFLYETPHINETDRAAIQRGARVFVNYCLTCHSAEYMRYKRVADDLGIKEEIMEKNLMFASDKIHEGMQAAINEDDARKWFGVLPPDLSVTARARGREWLYNYFMTFYRDDSRSIGINNATFKEVAMPHVLWELQGWQEPVIEKHVKKIKNEKGEVEEKTEEVIVGMKLVEPGKLTPKEYKQTVRDLVTFMVYMGEPAELKRHEIGFWVIAFLLVLLMLSYALKREYWKDVH